MRDGSLPHQIVVPVTHCICYDRPFTEILSECRRLEIGSLDDLVTQLGVGDKCRMCLPYLGDLLERDPPEKGS